MKKILLLVLFAPLILSLGCQKENLPPADGIYVKFVNQTGENINQLIVNQVEVGDIKKGSTTGDYAQYEKLGEQYKYALVESVGTIGGKRHYSSQACQGICGTPSAPDGIWLTPGYYKIVIRLAPPGNYIEYRMQK